MGGEDSTYFILQSSMVKGHTHTVIGGATQMTTVQMQTICGPRVCQVSVCQSPQSTPKAKKAKNTAAASSHSKLTSLLLDEPLLHQHLNFMDDIDSPSLKVTLLFPLH
jgi:hypothetical protein